GRLRYRSRGRRRDEGHHAHRGDPPRARDRPRNRGAAQAAGGCRWTGGRLRSRCRAARPARLLRAGRQGPRRAGALRGRPAVGERRVTGGEVRALCLSLPEATEKETWGDAENPGHPTFRVRDRIFVIMGTDETGASIKTSIEEQTALIASFPEAAAYAAYTG